MLLLKIAQISTILSGLFDWPSEQNVHNIEIAAPQPSIKGRITTSGFNFVSTYAQKLVQREVPKFPFPEFQDHIARISFWLYGFHISEFVSPNINFTVGDDGLNWKTDHGKIRIDGDLQVWYWVIFRILEHDKVVVHVYDTRVDMTAKIVNKEGKAAVEISHCGMALETMDVQTHGKIVAMIARALSGIIVDKIQSNTREHGCEMVQKTINEQINPFLANLPSRIPLGYDIFLVGSLVDQPIFTKDYLETGVALSVVYGNDTCSPTRELPWESVPTENSMASLLIDESVINCLFRAIYKSNLTTFMVDEGFQAAEYFLRTTCDAICIGSFLPELREKHPNKHVAFIIKPHEPPTVKFNDTSIINAVFEADMIIPGVLESGTETALAGFKFTACGSGSVFIQNNTLKGTIKKVYSHIELTFSKIGDVSQRLLDALDPIISNTAFIFLSSTLSRGYPLPDFDGIKLSDSTTLTAFKSYARADITLEMVNKTVPVPY